MGNEIKSDQILWVARDKQPAYKDIECGVFKSQPKMTSGMYPVTYSDTGMSNQEFRRIFGIKLKPGECKRVRIKIEEVK